LRRYSLKGWPLLPTSVLACTEPRLPPSYFFSATAQHYDGATARTSRCVVVGHVSVDSFALPPWSAVATLQIRREVVVVGGARVARDTSLAVPISTNQDSGRLVLILGPPFQDSLTGSVVSDLTQPSSGTWTCPSSLPFANDSSLKAEGYQAVPAPPGDWFFAPSLPIG
jgi:hypothetical protein